MTGPKFFWPLRFDRIPADDWTAAPLEEMAVQYDRLREHTWYQNLTPTIEQLTRVATSGDLVIDYSGGTGILVDRFRAREPSLAIGMLIVDASPKFLRVALEKLRHDEFVGFRLLRLLKDERRLERLHEVLGPDLLARRADVIVSTNAVHLYPDLRDTFRSWSNSIRPGGRVFINSGNIRNPAAAPGEWIIDQTVSAISDAAQSIVTSDPRHGSYREVLEDSDRLRAHVQFRDRVFPSPRPLEVYLRGLRETGFTLDEVFVRTITANVLEWYEFLRTYHEAVLGWVGGSVRVEGRPADATAVEDRLALMRDALETIFEARQTFPCCWTYIAATRSTS